MLETTFLGHQGWQFAAGANRILVDPLLVEPFGHRGGVGVVFPPRDVNIAAFPPIDAVVLTHEHEDHFNIPSLNRISRSVPIFVPTRASDTLREFLAEMGFTVSLLAAGQSVDIGDLRITSFSADHVRHDEQDEWETTPFLVQDRKDGGSFFSPVDISVPPALEAQLRQLCPSPSLWGYANNVMNLAPQERPPRPSPRQLPIAARFLAEHLRRPTLPLASLICGGGFSFEGSRAWMNRTFFPLDSIALAAALQSLTPDERFIAPAPGMQITCDRARIHSVTDGAPYLRAKPQASWPDRSYAPAVTVPDGVDPATGEGALDASQLAELGERLNAFAEFLYGGALFKALYSLGPHSVGAGIRPTFAISAFSGQDELLYEYVPSSATFIRRTPPAPMASYAAGLECHASDLLEFLRGNLPPSALMFGRICRWRGANEATTAAIDHAIWVYGHPLRRRHAHLRMYREILAAEKPQTAQIQRRAQ